MSKKFVKGGNPRNYSTCNIFIVKQRTLALGIKYMRGEKRPLLVLKKKK